MKTPDQFAWITARAAEIAHLLAAPNQAGRKLGAELLADLEEHYRDSYPEKIAQRRDRKDRTVAWYRELWSRLHRRALAHAGGDDLPWLMAFIGELPNGGCQCRNHTLAFMAQHPPDFRTAKSYFAWTVQLHNDANVRTKAPALSVPQALAIWSA